MASQKVINGDFQRRVFIGEQAVQKEETLSQGKAVRLFLSSASTVGAVEAVAVAVLSRSCSKGRAWRLLQTEKGGSPVPCTEHS